MITGATSRPRLPQEAAAGVGKPQGQAPTAHGCPQCWLRPDPQPPCSPSLSLTHPPLPFAGPLTPARLQDRAVRENLHGSVRGTKAHRTSLTLAGAPPSLDNGLAASTASPSSPRTVCPSGSSVSGTFLCWVPGRGPEDLWDRYLSLCCAVGRSLDSETTQLLRH